MESSPDSFERPQPHENGPAWGSPLEEPPRHPLSGPPPLPASALPPPLPEEKPLGQPGTWDLVLAFVVALGLQIFAGILFGIVYGLILGESAGRPERSPWMMPFGVAMNAVSMLWAAWFFGCRRYGKSFRDGLSVRPVSGVQILRAGFVGVGLAVAAIVVLAGLGADHAAEMEKSPIAQAIQSPAAWLLALLAILVPPIEELVFRGFAFSVLLRRWGRVAAIGLTTAVFAVLHAWQLAGNVAGLAVITGVGLVLAFQRLRTGSVIPSSVTHFVYNFLLVGLTALQMMVSPGKTGPGELRSGPPAPAEMKADLLGRHIADPSAKLPGWRFDSLEEFRRFEVLEPAGEKGDSVSGEKSGARDGEEGTVRYRVLMRLKGSEGPALETEAELLYSRSEDGYRFEKVEPVGEMRVR